MGKATRQRAALRKLTAFAHGQCEGLRLAGAYARKRRGTTPSLLADALQVATVEERAAMVDALDGLAAEIAELRGAIAPGSPVNAVALKGHPVSARPGRSGFVYGRRGGRVVLYLFRDGKCVLTVSRTYRRLFRAAYDLDRRHLTREELREAVFPRRGERALTASERASLARSLRSLERAGILDRQGGGVTFTEDGYGFARHVASLPEPKPLPGERELTWES